MKRDEHDCPRIEALSALLDGEMTESARRDIEAHAMSCPICGATLREFSRLRAAFGRLGEGPAGADVAALIDSRLPPRTTTRPARERWRWHLAPAGLVAAGALATGAYFGMLLGGSAAVGVARPPAIAVFDAVPPGGLCVAPICYGRGR